MCDECIAILLKASSNTTDWTIAREEWISTGKIDVDETLTSTCICGQSIKYNFELENDKTGDTVFVGSICINTIFEDEKLLKFVNTTYCKYCKEDIKRNNVSSHKKTAKHKKNLEIYKTQKKNKQCKCCKMYVIPKTSPSYKVYCNTCYKTLFSSKCIDCGKSTKGYKRCFSCNKNNV